MDACAGSVLATQEFAINAQKMLGNRSCTGEGGCRQCGTFLDPHLSKENPAALPKPLEATMLTFTPSWEDQDSLTLGITTEPLGLTEATSRPADLFPAGAVRGRSAARHVCVALINAAAG